tara:strand:- start:169944 stop:170192 length:249 start_codon:yes stop_codon:yes gene_type:complete
MDQYFSDSDNSSETIESYGGNSPKTKSENRINESKVKEFFKKYLLIKKELDDIKDKCSQLEKENRVLKIVNKRLANEIKKNM